MGRICDLYLLLCIISILVYRIIPDFAVVRDRAKTKGASFGTLF
jgi:competence protein ComGC